MRRNMKYLYDAEFIAQKLPQKYPLLLVDRILEYTPGRQIVGLKNVTQNEEFFVGHFPEKKIMPGVLICEALAQTCALFGILEAESQTDTAERLSPKNSMPGFIGGINVKFTKIVVPGDQLILKASSLKTFEGMHGFEVEALVDKIGRASCRERV